MESKPSRECKKIEDELQIALKRFYAILSSLYAGVLVVTNDGQVEFANQSFCDLFELDDSPESLRGLFAQEIIQKIRNVLANPSDAFAHITELVARGQPVMSEEVAIRGSRTYMRDFIPIIIDGKQYGHLWHHQDITQRKRAEHALKEKEKTLQVFFDAVHESMVLIDTKGIILLSNSVGAQRLGKTVPDFLGTCLYDWFPPDVARHRKEQYEKVVNTGEPFYFQDTRLGKVFEQYCYPIIDKERKVSGVAIFAHDITSRKLAENELRQSEEKYRSIIENSVMGIFLTTPDGRYLSANPAGARMWGYESPEEMIESITNMAHQIYVHPEDRERFKEMIEKSGSVEGFEAEFYAKDGSKIWASMNARAIRDTSGKVLYYETTFEDITKRKQAEKALMRSEEKYRSIFENSVEGIFQSTPEGRLLSINPSFARMTGYASPEEMIESITDLRFQAYVNPGDREQFVRLIAEHGIVEGYEIQHYRKDGSIFWVSINARCVYDDNGVPMYYEGTFEDITKRKLAEEELQNTMEKLRKSLAGTIQIVSMTVETRDPYTAGHQRRVANLARTIAQEMGLSSDTVDNIRMAGIIHDIGKISIPAELLAKPTKLTNIEFSLIQVHPQTGYDILKDVGLPYPVAEIVLQHHERLDGSGYPQGLKGDQILLEAKIISVADVVEAIATHRPYRPARGTEPALDEIEKNIGVLYDEKVVEVCLKLFREKGFAFE
jgi:PAS domain S-box-containing protein/putative nucleotidyltransferase with HDIG domain